MKKFYVLTFLFLTIFVNAQCPYPTVTLQSTGIQTFCVENPNQSINVNTNTHTFVPVNIVQGFKYTFRVADVYNSNETITVYNDSNNAILENSGAGGASIYWTATFSGQIKIIVSQGACLHNNNTSVVLNIQLNDVGNTLDNQTTSGTDKWIGHVYNWVTGNAPAGGASPSTLASQYPFDTANYLGYYNLTNETINENFGGDYVCFPVYSAGTVRTNIRTEKFAVRYRMRSTRPAGCYIVTLRGDDGVRLYNNGTLVFNEWKEQSPTSYSNVLVYLDGNTELVFDYYENGGGNVVDLSITPFNSSLNKIAGAANRTLCSNASAGNLDGSTFAYNGGTVNPTIAYQWQESTDNSTFSNISGATNEDYSPPAITNTGLTNIVRYYRRVMGPKTNSTLCNSISNTIIITTTSTTVLPVTTAATSVTCTSFTANWNPSALVTRYRLDVSKVIDFATYVSGYNYRDVGNVNSVTLSGLTAGTYYYRIRTENACGTSVYSAVITVNTTTLNAPIAQPATGVSCDSFTANWNGNANTSGYIIDVATTSTFSPGTFVVGYENLNIGDINSFNITNAYGSTIYYRVRAVNACATSTSSNTITVNRNVSTWNGSSWSTLPNSSTVAVINGNYNTTANGNFECCSLTVNAGFNLTINSSNYVLIHNNLDILGRLEVKNKGSLIQVNDFAINNGTISYERNTTGVALDYVYWSSPVSAATTPSGLVYKWSPTHANSNGGQGNWIGASNSTMQTGVGYIMRDIFTRTFVGKPNNGVIKTPISRGNDLNAGTVGPNGILRTTDDDNWNLIGNPYPSAINVSDFLTQNPQLDGFVNLWSHGTSPSTTIINPYYGNFSTNYSASDYVTINKTGSTFGPGLLSVIGSGQGFMVLMLPGSAATDNVTFNNSMRDKSLSNNQFYRNATQSEDKSRIWIDLTNSTGTSDRTLLAYIDGATDSRDRLYDAITEVGINTQRIYSFVDDVKLSIQSYGLTFTENDIIPFGIAIPQQGIYSISIHALDGLFENKTVYVKDALTGLTSNINLQPYSFTAEKGTFNNRFSLVFRDSNLSTDEFNTIANGVFVTNSNNLEVNSTQESISQIEVYDILGRSLLTKKALNSNKVVLDTLLKTDAALLIKIQLQNGQVVTKKVIY